MCETWKRRRRCNESIRTCVYVNIPVDERGGTERSLELTDTGAPWLIESCSLACVCVRVYDSVASPPYMMHRGGSTCAPQSCGPVAPCSKVSKLPRPRKTGVRAHGLIEWRKYILWLNTKNNIFSLISKRIELNLEFSVPARWLFDSSLYLHANNQFTRCDSANVFSSVRRDQNAIHIELAGVIDLYCILDTCYEVQFIGALGAWRSRAWLRPRSQNRSIDSLISLNSDSTCTIDKRSLGQRRMAGC